MPASKLYRVEEERSVLVRASSPADAVQIADAAFKGHAPEEGVEGSVQGSVDTKSINAREEF